MESKSYIGKLINGFASVEKEKAALLMYDGEKLTQINYTQLYHDIRCASAYFIKNGIKGRHIALISQESYDWIVTLLAVIASGNIVMPINPALSEDVLQWQCQKADVALVCSDERNIAQLKTIITDVEYLAFDKLGSASPVSVIHDPEKDDTVIFMCTSGTTGKSKIVELTDENIGSGAMNAHTEIGKTKEWEYSDTVSLFLPLPLYHIGGLKTLLSGLHHHHTLCLGRGMKYVYMDMPVLNPTHFIGVPTIFESLDKILKRSKTMDWKKVLGQRLMNLYVCGAAIKESTAKAVLEKGMRIENLYGMTETMGDGLCCDLDEAHLSALGKPNKNVQLRIENGELLIKSAGVMKGYYKDPEETKKVIKNGWLHTGDMVRCDENGCYYITGRKKNVIILSNGENVNPEEIESIFARCPVVDEVLVYSDGKGICADVFTANQSETERFIKSYNDDVPMYRQVYKVNYQNEPLEKTPSGKIKRKVNI